MTLAKRHLVYVALILRVCPSALSRHLEVFLERLILQAQFLRVTRHLFARGLALSDVAPDAHDGCGATSGADNRQGLDGHMGDAGGVQRY